MTFREEYSLYQARYPKKRTTLKGTKILFRWHRDTTTKRKKAVIFPGETGMMDITYRMFNGLAHCYDIVTFDLPRAKNDKAVINTLIQKTVGTPDIIVGFGMAGVLAGQYCGAQAYSSTVFVTDDSSYMWLKGDARARTSAKKIASEVNTGVKLAKNLPRMLIARKGKQLFFSYVGECAPEEQEYLNAMYDKLTASVSVDDLAAQADVISNTLSDVGDYRSLFAKRDFLVFCESGAATRDIQGDGKNIISFYDYKDVLLKSRNYFNSIIDRLS